MKISLVTTVRNAAGQADALIRCILDQTRPPDEWIVVDGGSDDGTSDLFRAVPFCTVLEQPCNRARGRNLAIARARGEIIAVTDAGCLPAPDWLEKLTAHLPPDRRRIAAGPTVCRIRRPFDAAQHVLMDQFAVKGLCFRRPAASCRSLAFPRRAWEECAFPEWLDIGEDSWLLLRWQHQGWCTELVPGAAMEWQPRPGPGGLVRQYFSYIRGEGRAGIHTGRHLLRVLFYLGLALLPLAGGGAAWSWTLALFLWLAYLLVTALRLPGVVRGRPLFFVLRTILWLPPALAAMDAAKTAGFIVGSLERILDPRLRRRGWRCGPRFTGRP